MKTPKVVQQKTKNDEGGTVSAEAGVSSIPTLTDCVWCSARLGGSLPPLYRHIRDNSSYQGVIEVDTTSEILHTN